MDILAELRQAEADHRVYKNERDIAVADFYGAAAREIEQLRRDKAAILRMLISRATLMDRWIAWRKPGHWLHQAKREVLIGQGHYPPIPKPPPPPPPKMNFGTPVATPFAAIIGDTQMARPDDVSNRGQEKVYTVTNPTTGETRTCTQREFREQHLGRAGFVKPDEMPDEEVPEQTEEPK